MLKKLYTHAGKIHADDVATAAIIKLLNPEVEIFRVFNVDTLENSTETIIADIGGGKYDHHQKDAPIRPDGLPHCAVSLVWADFGREVVKQICLTEDNELATLTASKFDEMVIRSICAADNGIKFSTENESGLGGEDVFSFVEIVRQYNPAWNSVDSLDNRFFQAVVFAEQTFRYTLQRIYSVYEAEHLLEEYIARAENNSVLVMEKFIPWQEYISQKTGFKFVIYPSNRGGYNLQIVPERGVLPSNWYGAMGESAQTVQQGMTFCHKNGFMASFDTLENAYQAALTIIA